MYLTYAEYEQYGGALEETAFDMYEFEAASKIDYYTFNRLKKDVGFDGQSENTKEAVKRCIYRLIFLLQQRDSANVVSGEEGTGDNTAVAGISSQSNDGVSVSYNVMSASEVSANADKEITNTISMYLSGCRNSLGQRLLYRGIYGDE